MNTFEKDQSSADDLRKLKDINRLYMALLKYFINKAGMVGHISPDEEYEIDTQRKRKISYSPLKNI